MFEINGKTYVLKYNMKRIEMIENVTRMPTLAELQRTNGMLGISSLKAYLSYGLKEEGTDVFVKPKEGMQMAEVLIESEGYASVCGVVVEAIERDCPFFFQAG